MSWPPARQSSGRPADWCVPHRRKLFGELSPPDLRRPFGDGRTYGDLALERGRLHFLAAFLHAGGLAPGKGAPPLGVGPTGRLAPLAAVARCAPPARRIVVNRPPRIDGVHNRPGSTAPCPRPIAGRNLAAGWPGHKPAVSRSLRPGSHASDLGVYLKNGVVGVSRAARARRRDVLEYMNWIRARAGRNALRFDGDGAAPLPSPAKGGHAKARRLLGEAAAPPQRSPRAATPRSRTAQILKRCGAAAPAPRPEFAPRPAPSAEVAVWLAARGLGALLAAQTASADPAPAPAPVAEVQRESPRADDDLECGICLSLLADPVHTPCLHVFCRSCLNRALRPGKRRCPACRAAVPSGAATRCGGALVARLDRLRGDAAALAPLHPRLDVRLLGESCGRTLDEQRRLAAAMRAGAAPLADARSRDLPAKLEAQRLALAVAILCHPGLDPAVRDRVEAYL